MFFVAVGVPVSVTRRQLLVVNGGCGSPTLTARLLGLAGTAGGAWGASVADSSASPLTLFVLPHAFDALVLGAYTFRGVRFEPLGIRQCPSLPLTVLLVLKSALCEVDACVGVGYLPPRLHFQPRGGTAGELLADNT